MNLAAWTGFDLELCGRLCLVLAHSLWQFALLAGLAAIVSRVWKSATPEQLYALYAGVLLLGLLLLPITFALTRLPGESVALSDLAIAPQRQTLPIPHSSPAKQLPVQQAAPPPSVADALPETPIIAQVSHPADLLSWTPWFVACYVAGVAIMLLRLLRGLWQNYRLSTTASPLTSGSLNEMLRDLASRWTLRVTPALAMTERVIVPQVVGLWRPTILLPAAALTGLRPDELEMILAHELAHVRRYDLWANLVQRVTEAVLFFNPAVWYLSRRISTFREYCCDEATCRLARHMADDTRLRYAEALLRAVELTQGSAQGQKLAALAASGRGPSELRRRVARLFGEPLREPLRVSRTGLLSIAAGIAVLLMVPLARQNAAETKEDTKQAEDNKKPTVEVLGIGTYDQEPQRWWDTEGKLLEDVPFQTQGVSLVGEARQLVFRIADLPKDADVTWSLIGCGSNANGEVVLNGEESPHGYFSRVFAIREDSPTVKLRVGVTTGEWQKITTASSIGGHSTELSNGKRIAFAGTFIERDPPSKTKRAAVVVVSHNFSDTNVRVLAVDKSGKSHRPSGSSTQGVGNGVILANYSFRDLLPENIDHFELQTRLYEWTEIKDLPVEPGERGVPSDNGQSVDPRSAQKAAVRRFEDPASPSGQQDAWVSKLRRLTEHNQTAFAVGPLMIFELPPDEAWEVVRSVWPELEIDEVKTGLLKTFEFARHERVLDVLDLGATDESEFVRDYAHSYLPNYALRDFKSEQHDYREWRREYAGKPTEEVLAASCRWFVDNIRSRPPITDTRAWQDMVRMLELKGSKSSYPSKAKYLREAGLGDVLRSWQEDRDLDERVNRRIAEFLSELDKALDETASHKNADLSGRSLDGLVLQGNVSSLFAGANLSRTDLSDASLVGGRKAFYETDFSDSNLSGATLIGSAAFQKANFQGATLEHTLMKGGVSGIQIATFDGAIIKHSRLVGSLQLATFRGALLEDARLEGVGPALQLSNFDDATLKDTTILKASFQAVSVNNTRFIACDLSDLRANDLKSCKFDPSTPPQYNAATKFPEGFDPEKHGWKLIGEP